MKIRDFIERLSTYNPEAEVISVIWQKCDVLFRANDLGIELTEAQASQIIESLVLSPWKITTMRKLASTGKLSTTIFKILALKIKRSNEATRSTKG